MIGRRAVLAAAACATAVRAESLDARPTLDAFARLTGDIGGGTALRWHPGVINAVMPGEAPRPLVGFDGLEKEVWTASADGSFATAYFDIGYFKDLSAGAPLASWTNPVTGGMTTPMPFRSGRFAATLRPGELDRTVDIRGDDLWFTSRPTVAFPSILKPDLYPEESAGPLHFFSVVRIDRGRLSEAIDIKIRSAALAWSYTLTTVWLPWMKMGQRPGAAVWTGVGGKYRSAAEVPPAFRDFLAREQPNYLDAGDPWSNVRNMWGDYAKAHPARR